jgi:hypothetical protein
LDILSRHKINDPLLADIITNIEQHHVQEQQIYLRLKEIGEILNLPIGMVQYNFRYMPDGRPIDWPVGFKADVQGAAKRLELPVYDAASLVQVHGVDIAMDGKSGHYADAFNDVVAGEYANFMSAVIVQKQTVNV